MQTIYFRHCCSDLPKTQFCSSRFLFSGVLQIELMLWGTEHIDCSSLGVTLLCTRVDNSVILSVKVDSGVILSVNVDSGVILSVKLNSNGILSIRIHSTVMPSYPLG